MEKQNNTSEKIYYKVDMAHDEDTFTALAHMQYDLFCTRNYVVRMILSIVIVLIGCKYFSQWFGILLLAYGGYLMTGKYSSANHTAHKLVKSLQDAKLPFPSSTFIFEKDRMRVISKIDEEELSPLYYSNIIRLGADFRYFYLFRNEVGGYMIPKDQLGDNPNAFRDFIEKKTGKVFVSRRTTPVGRVSAWMRKRQNEPYHL